MSTNAKIMDEARKAKLITRNIIAEEKNNLQNSDDREYMGRILFKEIFRHLLSKIK